MVGRVRLVSFNLLHGRSLTDGLVDADRLRTAMQALDADILGIQEVDRDQPRSSGLDLTALAAEALGAPYFRFSPALNGTPGGQWQAARDADAAGFPAYGVGLISRLPVHRWEVRRLAAAPIRSPVLGPGSRRPIWVQDEPRVLLAAVLTARAVVRTVATTHLSFVPGWNVVQLRQVVAALRRLPGPRVLLGDLNLPGPLPRWLSGWHPLAKVKTYPVDRPSVQLDHVLAERPGPRVLAAEARALPLSDHRAVIVDLAEESGECRERARRCRPARDGD